jgi:uncharacterized membrane protein
MTRIWIMLTRSEGGYHQRRRRMTELGLHVGNYSAMLLYLKYYRSSQYTTSNLRPTNQWSFIVSADAGMYMVLILMIILLKNIHNNYFSYTLFLYTLSYVVGSLHEAFTHRNTYRSIETIAHSHHALLQAQPLSPSQQL